MYLDKRESYNSFSIAPPLIIFLVILGAGALTCCGFAIYRFHSGAEPDSAFKPRSEEQDAYMREVRERNWSHLPNYAKKDMYTAVDARYGHAPMTPSAHSTTTWGG